MPRTLVIVIILFPLWVHLARVLLPRVPKAGVLALGSLAGLFLLTSAAFQPLTGSRASAQHLAEACLVAYLGLAVVHWGLLRRWAQRGGWRTLASFLFPILVLVLVKYLPLAGLFMSRAGFKGGAGTDLLLGISYMAFRLSYLTLEVRNGTVPPPGIVAYLAFAFFLPTLSVGPINTYANHCTPGEGRSGAFGHALRVLLGAVKYLFLAVLVNQLTYTGLFLDGHPHAWVDLPIAMASYYVYLYLNFSGYCDMAIGTAGLVGIRCAENFDNPFAARNVKEFWNRWHITLSTYMRDVVFSPLSKWLVRRVGATRANHATAACIMVVFLIVGVWHGVGWNFLLFGLAHGLAVVANHYYTLFLKKRLGRERFLAYGKNPLVRWIAVGSTFAYISASLFLFANDIPSMRSIFALLR